MDGPVKKKKRKFRKGNSGESTGNLGNQTGRSRSAGDNEPSPAGPRSCSPVSLDVTSPSSGQHLPQHAATPGQESSGGRRHKKKKKSRHANGDLGTSQEGAQCVARQLIFLQQDLDRKRQVLDSLQCLTAEEGQVTWLEQQRRATKEAQRRNRREWNQTQADIRHLAEKMAALLELSARLTEEAHALELQRLWQKRESRYWQQESDWQSLTLRTQMSLRHRIREEEAQFKELEKLRQREENMGTNRQ